MNRKQIRKSEFRDLNQKILDLYGRDSFLDKKKKTELVEDDFKIIAVDGKPFFFFYEDNEDIIIPTLMLCQHDCFLKKIVVDMGAVRFVVGGADIMRPGIVEIDDSIEKDEFVAVVDEKNKKPLAIGRAMYSGTEIAGMSHGKVLRNIHYVGDKLWNFRL